MQDFRMDTFLSVCETLNYTRTAETLHITQPAVSQHIHYLEQAYGAKLFHYEGKRLEMTEQGRILFGAARAMSDDEDVLRRKIEAANGGRERLVLGLTMTVAECIAADSLARFVLAHDEVQVTVKVGDTGDLIAALDNGEVDCAVVEGYFDKTSYESRRFSREPFVGVCSPGMLDVGRTYGFDELLDRRLITREPGSGTRAILEHALSEDNLSIDDFPRVTVVNNISLIRRLVARGCGISFLYEMAVAKRLGEGTLQRISLLRDPLAHDITAVWRKGGVYGDFYERVVDELSTFSQAEKVRS